MIRKLLIVLLCVFLQSCVSASQARMLDDGKASFNDGDFPEAFQKLMPLAAAGNPHAEYAVGYMYYYGYGVTRDSTSGLFWMQKAADQNDAAAQKALTLIHSHVNDTQFY